MYLTKSWSPNGSLLESEMQRFLTGQPQGFVPGGISLHNCMLPHGPDREAFDHASNGELKPVKLTGTMAFMFETRFPQRVTRYAATSPILQDDYADCWKGLEKRFDPNRA